MHAVLPGTGFPVCAPWRSCHPGKEIAESTLFLSSKGRLVQFSAYGIKSEGNRRGRSKRESDSDIPVKRDDKLKDSSSSIDESSKSSSQEEILALFRRIQSSISEGGPVMRKNRNTSIPKVSQAAKSFQEAQRQYPTQKRVRGKISSQSKDHKPPLQRAILNKDERKVDAEKFKLSRPPSNFVKRSPIPSATLLRENTGQAIGEGSPATVAGELPGLQSIDGLKLSELKELAKSRGIKGYSKLKKGELVDLLNRLLSST
uniref:SAP-like protein BP-73 n=2 Tax=Anthurium amnicola TaxID=1678845 RepID=A0A1D1Y6L4_9ARAE